MKPQSELQGVKKVTPKQLKLNLFELDPLLDKNYSNTIEIYDLAGKFIYDKHSKSVAQFGSAEEMEFSRTVSYQETNIHISVTAANIERTIDGKKTRVFVFPGAREEIIEDVLRKMATESNGASAYQERDAQNELLGVEFSYYEIHNELKSIGRTFSYQEIYESLDIMNRSVLSIQSENGAISLAAPFFPVVASANKQTDDDTARAVVCFHPMVANAIQCFKFRRYNYVQALNLRTNYARLTYKRLCHRWVQASPEHPYSILLSTLIKAIKAPYPNLYQDKALFTKVLNELQSENILSKWTSTPKKKGRKIIDWRFDLYATKDFTKQMAGNNKVNKRLQNTDR